MDIGQFIVKTPGTCGGRARLAGKRIPVSSIYRWFLRGSAPEDILDKFEGVSLSEIYAAISYALANREEIAGEIETEDRLSLQAASSMALASGIQVSRISLQLDEDCQAHSLSSAFRQHGIDAVTTTQSGLTGVNDETQLRAAFAAGRVLVTNNICDFVPLHAYWISQGRDHGGIIVIPQQAFSIGEIVRRMARLAASLTAEQMRNRLEWLNAWGIDKP